MKCLTSDASRHMPPGGIMPWCPIWAAELRFQRHLHSVWPTNHSNRNSIQREGWALWLLAVDVEKRKDKLEPKPALNWILNRYTLLTSTTTTTRKTTHIKKKQKTKLGPRKVREPSNCTHGNAVRMKEEGKNYSTNGFGAVLFTTSWARSHQEDNRTCAITFSVFHKLPCKKISLPSLLS